MRLPFALHDFTRLIWHNDEARRVWPERINNINEAWSRIERWAVVEGARQSALTFFEPHYLPEATAWAASHGLVLLPLAQVGVADQYSATPTPVTVGRPWQYRAVLTRPELVTKWLDAWKDTGSGGEPGRYQGTNNRAIGELLGYPRCCIDFFERTWVNGGSLDTTWDMAMGTTDCEEHENHVTVGGAPECNILLRWLGVRLVAHLPCAFDCAATVQMASSFAEVGRKRHFGEWVDWIYEMLEWPVEWSALHGIAEIRTPVLTISSRTNATARKLVVQRPGKTYPNEGAQGLRFPFRIVKDKIAGSPSFKRSVQPIWELNGFSSQAAMEEAHRTILAVLSTFTPGKLLDLGSGTGRLLELAQKTGWSVTGIENDPVRAGAAKVRTKRGDLFEVGIWEGKFDVVLLMPGRLIEQPEKAEALRAALNERAGIVLCYAYGDWLTRYGDLNGLVQAAGLEGRLGAVACSDGVQAGMFRPAREPAHV